MWSAHVLTFNFSYLLTAVRQWKSKVPFIATKWLPPFLKIAICHCLLGEIFRFWTPVHAIHEFELKFIYSEKTTKFCELFPFLLLTVCTLVKSKVKISQNFVAFSEYMNFNKSRWTPNFLAFLVRKLERTTTSALYNSKRNKWNLAHNEIRILLTMWALKLTISYIKSFKM